MDFIKIMKTSRFLDPARNFAEARRHSEVRRDPLTGHSSRILDFPIKKIDREDLSALVEGSRAFCPFCPEVVELVTPKFHPDLLKKERYSQGEALCVPNVFPYDENGAVCVMCRQHYVPLLDFTAPMLEDALSCCFAYLKDVVVNQPDMIYQSVNWNYMPQAGGSIVHPHLQIAASSSPTNYYAAAVPALSRYRSEHGSDYWPDLVVVVSGFFIHSLLAEIMRNRGHKVVMVMTESPYEDDRQLEQADGVDAVVLNDPTMNGFALPGGYIFITRGALAMCADESEAAAFIGAAPYERSGSRVAQRNGTRPRPLLTTAGELDLRIPKLRAGTFFPSLLERRRRVDQALFAVVMEAYVHGVSTRKVGDRIQKRDSTALTTCWSEPQRRCIELNY